MNEFLRAVYVAILARQWEINGLPTSPDLFNQEILGAKTNEERHYWVACRQAGAVYEALIRGARRLDLDQLADPCEKAKYFSTIIRNRGLMVERAEEEQRYLDENRVSFR